MNVLIIFTHPDPKSFNAEILKQVQTNLSKAHTVKTSDLYAEHFDPILRFDENHRRRDLAVLSETKKIPRSDYLGRPYNIHLSRLVERDACHAQRVYRPRFRIGLRVFI